MDLKANYGLVLRARHCGYSHNQIPWLRIGRVSRLSYMLREHQAPDPTGMVETLEAATLPLPSNPCRACFSLELSLVPTEY